MCQPPCDNVQIFRTTNLLCHAQDYYQVTKLLKQFLVCVSDTVLGAEETEVKITEFLPSSFSQSQQRDHLSRKSHLGDTQKVYIPFPFLTLRHQTSFNLISLNNTSNLLSKQMLMGTLMQCSPTSHTHTHHRSLTAGRREVRDASTAFFDEGKSVCQCLCAWEKNRSGDQ